MFWNFSSWRPFAITVIKVGVTTTLYSFHEKLEMHPATVRARSGPVWVVMVFSARSSLKPAWKHSCQRLAHWKKRFLQCNIHSDDLKQFCVKIASISKCSSNTSHNTTDFLKKCVATYSVTPDDQMSTLNPMKDSSPFDISGGWKAGEPCDVKHLSICENISRACQHKTQMHHLKTCQQNTSGYEWRISSTAKMF